MKASPRPDLVTRGLFALALALPFVAAVAHAGLVDDGAHDAAILRGLGLAASRWPTPDGVLAAPFIALPVGTLVFRLALPSAVSAALASAALFVLARRVAARVIGDETPRLVAAVATFAALATTLGRPWQVEATGPLGATIGAAAALGAMAWVAREADAPDASWRTRLRLDGLAGRMLPVLAASLALVVIFALRRAHGGPPVAEPTAWTWIFDRARVTSFVMRDVGAVTTLLAALGLGVALIAARSRWVGAGLALAGAVAAAFVGWGANVGPERFSAFALVVAAVVQSFAGLGLTWVVRRVARLRLPLATASAAMVALLGAAFPAIAYDEATFAREAKSALERVDWGRAIVGDAPDGALVVLEDRRATERLVAAGLIGELPTFLEIVPLDDIGGPMVRAALARTPSLVPLVRDVTLTGLPTEVALSNLAADHAVHLVYNARFERALARHLVPAGALDRFEPEPRGVADRKRGVELAEEALAPVITATREADARAMGGSTAALLGARAEGFATIHDRELGARTVATMQAFAPGEARIAALEARFRGGKGREASRR